MARVSALHIYPVKSCRGHRLESAAFDAWGLAGDRRYLIITPDGQFVTQRQLPRLALVDTQLDSGRLTLGSPGRRSVTLPPSPPAPLAHTVTIWKDQVQAEDCGDEAAEWLTRFLGAPLRLVRMGPHYHRPVKPSRARPGDVVSFADAYPFLVISEASLDDLNDRLVARHEEPLPMNRFRPNIVVADCAPYAEDAWIRVRIGPARFRNSGPCARCVITTTDQLTAERGKEPLRTLASYRRDPRDPADVNFGVNLIHESPSGALAVGDRVETA
ncbi:MAG: MOSC N-terminal beta barrel domain-containing protein [Opitutaceae bacterium]|nr:MOSC N-terminal beta barrel domain-containing protein [Opitutaceae bacterium]